MPDTRRGQEPGPAPRKRRRWLRLLLGVFALGLVGLIATAGLLFAIDRGWQRDRIVGFAADQIEKNFGIPIEIESAGGRLSEGLEFRHIVVGREEAPIARIASLSIRWRAASFLSGNRWVVERVRVRGVAAEIRRTREGEWAPIDSLLADFAKRSAAQTESSDAIPRRLLVQRIEIADSELGLIFERASEAKKDTPVRVRLGADGELRDLRLVLNDSSEDAPVRLGQGRLETRLIEIDSGFPELDGAASANLDLRSAGLAIESAELSLDALGIRARGRAAGTIERLDSLVLEIASQDLATLNALEIVDGGLAGKLEGRADLFGPPRSLTGTIDLDSRKLVHPAFRTERLVLHIDLREGVDLQAIDFDTLSAGLALHAEKTDLGSFANEWLPPGRIDADIVGDWRGGTLDLERGVFRHPHLALNAKGQASAKNLKGLELDVQTEELAPWLALLRPDLPLRGALDAKARLDGPVEFPSGRVVLRSPALEFEGRPLGALDLRIDRDAKAPARFDFSLGEEIDPALRLRGQIEGFGPDGPNEKGERVELEGTARIAALLPLLENAPAVEGRVEARGFFARTAAGPRFDLDLRSQDTVYEGIPVGLVEVAATRSATPTIEMRTFSVAGERGSIRLRKPTQIAIDSRNAWQVEQASFALGLPGRADSSGKLLIDAKGVAARLEQAETTFDGLPVALVGPFLSDAPVLAGRLSGRAKWRDARAAGWTEGQVDWNAPTIGNVRFDQILTRWTGEVAAVDLEIETRLEKTSPISLRGRIDLPTAGDPAADLPIGDRVSLEADLVDWDLAALEQFTPEWMRQPTGRISGSIRVKQTPEGVELGGRTRIQNGGFTVPLLRQRFTPINGTLRLEGQTVTVDSLQIGPEEAGAHLVGSVGFEDPSAPAVEARLRFDQFPLARSSAAHLDVLGGIDISGTLAEPKIVGELKVANARIGVPATDDPVLKEIRIATRGQNGTLSEPDVAAEDPLGRAEIGIDIVVPDSTRVRGQGANLFVEGNARIEKKPAGTTRILGEARVVNGTYKFQGRAFEVRRGRVLLTGDERLDPVVDVEARLPVADIIAIVELSGRLSAPIVQLRSDPPLSDQDVLAYLLFGRAADEVAAAGNTRFGAAAARLVAGVAESELRDVLGDAMPVDSIEIGADAEGNTSEVGFGKYLSPNLFFRYVHVLGDEPSDRVGVEYRVNDTFSVGSSVSTTGDAGLDLILRHDF